MKNTTLPAALSIAALLACACHSTENIKSILGLQKKGSSVRTVTSMENGEERLEYAGTVRLNDAGTAIDSISPDGYVDYVNHGHHLRIVPAPVAGVQMRFDGENGVGDRVDTALLTAALRAIVSGDPAGDDRMHRLYHLGGSKALLEHIDLLQSDKSRSDYFGYLLSVDTLPADQLVDLTNRIGTQLHSDKVKKDLLLQFTKRHLASTDVVSAYCRTAWSFTAAIDRNSALGHLQEEGVRPL